MKRILLLAVLFAGPAPYAAAQPQPTVSGLRSPESVAVAADGKIYVTEIGEIGKDGDGAVMVVENGKAVPFVTGLDDPKGIAAFQKWLFVAERNKVLRIDAAAKQPKAEVFAAADKFPVPPRLAQRHGRGRRERHGLRQRRRQGRQGRRGLPHQPPGRGCFGSSWTRRNCRD